MEVAGEVGGQGDGGNLMAIQNKDLTILRTRYFNALFGKLRFLVVGSSEESNTIM